MAAIDLLIRTKETGDGIKSAKEGIGSLSKAAGVAGLAIVGALGFAVKSASDLQESVGAVGKVFGTSADKVLAFGETSRTAVGLSQSAFNDLAVPLGALLSNVGLSADATAEQTINLTKRAADLASLFNTDVSTALEAINSGLKGEADPLEQFGIGMSQAALEAFAMSKGIDTAVKDMTDQEKTLLRIDLLMEQSASSAGNFAETQTGLANSLKTGEGIMGDLAARIGESLLPIVEKLLGVIIPFLENAFIWIGANQELIQILVPVVAGLGLALTVIGALGVAVPIFATGIGALTAVFGFATGAVGSFGIAINLALWPIALIVLAIAGAIAIGVLLVKNWDTVSAKAIEIWEGIKEFFSATWDFLTGLFRDSWDKISEITIGVLTAITTKISVVWEGIKGFLSTTWDFLTGLFQDNWDKILAILFPLPGIPILIARNWGQITEVIGGIFDAASQRVKDAANAMIGFINGIIGAWNGLEFRLGGKTIFGGTPLEFTVPSVSFGTPNIGLIPRLQTGGYVQRGGLAVVHPGEVLPAAQVQRGRTGGTTVNVTINAQTLGDQRQTRQLIIGSVSDAIRRGELLGATA